jgi:hypothetical protein
MGISPRRYTDIGLFIDTRFEPSFLAFLGYYDGTSRRPAASAWPIARRVIDTHFESSLHDS